MISPGDKSCQENKDAEFKSQLEMRIFQTIEEDLNRYWNSEEGAISIYDLIKLESFS